MPEFKYQGTTAEQSTLQKFNQGVCTDVLKLTPEVRDDIKKHMTLSKYHPCLSAAADWLLSFFKCIAKEISKPIEVTSRQLHLFHQLMR